MQSPFGRGTSTLYLAHATQSAVWPTAIDNACQSELGRFVSSRWPKRNVLWRYLGRRLEALPQATLLKSLCHRRRPWVALASCLGRGAAHLPHNDRALLEFRLTRTRFGRGLSWCLLGRLLLLLLHGLRRANWRRRTVPLEVQIQNGGLSFR